MPDFLMLMRRKGESSRRLHPFQCCPSPDSSPAIEFAESIPGGLEGPVSGPNQSFSPCPQKRGLKCPLGEGTGKLLGLTRYINHALQPAAIYHAPKPSWKLGSPPSRPISRILSSWKSCPWVSSLVGVPCCRLPVSGQRRPRRI